jgi:hypothetical protein
VQKHFSEAAGMQTGTELGTWGSSGLPVIVGVDLATNGSLPISELLGLCEASALLGLLYKLRASTYVSLGLRAFAQSLISYLHVI